MGQVYEEQREPGDAKARGINAVVLHGSLGHVTLTGSFDTYSPGADLGAANRCGERDRERERERERENGGRMRQRQGDRER